jgi:acetylornithine deacetylase
MKALRYAKRLIEFNSTSHLSNAAISKYIEMKLTKHGFIVEKTGYLDGKGVRKINIVAKKGGGYGGLAWFGHSDVVPAKRWFSKKFGPFEPAVARERLYGRGSCDMKGSIACILEAAQNFSWEDFQQPLYIVVTADEEIGFDGARVVAADSKYYREMVQHQTKAIIGEPTMMDIVHAHKGCYEFTATASGVAAHSSSRDGINANLKLIPFLSELSNIAHRAETEPGLQNHQFDPPTLSFNISIEGDRSALNVTSSKAKCHVNFRPMPNVDHHQLIQQVQHLANACDLQLELHPYGDPFWADPDSNFVKQSLQLVHKKASRTVAYGTDGGVFSELKDKIVCGPGSIAQAHTKNEWISLEQLHQGTDVYSKMIRHWCCDAATSSATTAPLNETATPALEPSAQPVPPAHQNSGSPTDDAEFQFDDAKQEDLGDVQNFLQPFMDQRHLLQRTSLELQLLLKHGFICRLKKQIVGFAAFEMYSKKLGEIQCLAVDENVRRRGVGGQLVHRCVQRAREQKVKEVMAISASEDMFKSCGFEYSLPNQKRAFFIEPGE